MDYTLPHTLYLKGCIIFQGDRPSSFVGLGLGAGGWGWVLEAGGESWRLGAGPGGWGQVLEAEAGSCKLGSQVGSWAVSLAETRQEAGRL